MPVYLATYDLDKPGQDYPSLIKALRDVGAVRLQLSVWLLEVASQTAIEVREAMRSHMDENDRVFVLEITNDAGWAGYRMMPPSGNWLLARRG